MPDNDAVTRLDQLLHERGLAETRSRAQALVMAGRVRVDGRVVTKAGTAIAESAALEVEQGPRVRLARRRQAGDRRWPPSARRRRARTASTSAPRPAASPTACCRRGAAHVIALDVGRGQLHERLRADDRGDASWRASTPACLAPGDLPGPAADLAVVDVSFISLALVLPPLVRRARAP